MTKFAIYFCVSGELISISELFRVIVAILKKNILAVKRFLFISGVMAGAAVFVSAVIMVILVATADKKPEPIDIDEFYAGTEEEEHDDYLLIDVERPEDDDDGGLVRPPARTNFLLVGLDESSLADAIVVGTFYRDNGHIHMMSVPRDTGIRIPAHRLEQMRADGLRPPSIIKLNEMRTYGGRETGIYYLKDQISEMFGVEFDFFVEVRIPAFRRIVDAIGGVYMDIPNRLYYSDPDQNLLIDVPAGEQVRLNGNMAEGVVRYRRYPQGDLARNDVQMDFMRALISQLATREALLSNPMEMVSIVIDEVRIEHRENIAILEITKFFPYIRNISGETVVVFKMPGHVGHLRGSDRDLFIPNAELLPDIISDIFYTIYDGTEDEVPESE